MSQRKKISRKINKIITKKALIQKGERVLVAFSGGADSVCLLYALNLLKNKIGFELFAAHLNHGLRGDAAEHDAEFSKAFCEKLGIECTVFYRDVREYAKEQGISEELAGRDLRYSLFFDLMSEKGIDKLAVAHHADDQAETVMMHLMRGSGIDGLSGMRAFRNNIIRPLLDVTKSEILEFCREENLDFCTDETNFEAVYSRNKVRLELIPKMSEFNPNIAGVLSQTAEILGAEADYLESVAEAEFRRITDENSCELKELSKLHLAIRRRVIRKMIEAVRLSKKDISADYVNKVLELSALGETGKKLDLGAKVLARIEYDRLIIEKKREKRSFSYKLGIDEVVGISEVGKEIKIEKSEYGDFSFPENALFCIRSRQNGDRIYPCGMSGSKKLKDFFIDEKVSRAMRDMAVILTCNEEIAAVFYSDKSFFDRRFYKMGRGEFCIKISDV